MANGIKVTPTINSKGLFSVQSPFRVNPKKIYEVVAIRELEDLYNDHIDIYQYYYKPFKIDEETCKKDIKNNVAIITLKGEDGLLFIPDTYIISYPDLGTADYRAFVVSIDLGMLNKNFSFEGLKEDIAELVSLELGIKPKVSIHERPFKNVLSQDDALRLEESRKGLKKIPETYANKYEKMKDINSAIIANNNAKLLKLLKK